MTSTDSDSDFDISDDEFFESWKKNKMKDESKINDAKILSPINNTDLHSEIDDYSHKIFEAYMNRGSEINEDLRERSGSSYRKIINEMDKNFRRLSSFGVNGEYLISYRCQKNDYFIKGLGYLSTSNRYMRGFGTNCFILMIPKDAKIGIIELRNEKQSGIYEYILPRETDVIKLSDSIYTINTTFYNQNRDRFVKTARDMNDKLTGGGLKKCKKCGRYKKRKINNK